MELHNCNLFWFVYTRTRYVAIYKWMINCNLGQEYNYKISITSASTHGKVFLLYLMRFYVYVNKIKFIKVELSFVLWSVQ